jgi:hypothetical protein
LAVIYLVVFGGFACLFPLATYCLIMASVNGRRRPTVVSGAADFAGVLVATAGFLIVGGPLILAGLHEAWRRQALRGSFATIRTALDAASGPWLVAWLGYFVFVVGGTAWLMFRRRAMTVIYNIDPIDAQKVVADLTGRRGPGLPAVTVVPGMRHATVRWPVASGEVRRQLESDLRRAVADLESAPNPFAGWLLAAATGLFALLLIMLGLYVGLLWSLRR